MERRTRPHIGGMQGLQPFYLATLVPKPLHLQYKRLTEVPRLGAQSAQAALVGRKRQNSSLPVELEEKNWRQSAKWAAPTSCSKEPTTMVMGSTQLEDESRKLPVRGTFSCLMPGKELVQQSPNLYHYSWVC